MFSEEVNVAPFPPELEIIAPKQVGPGDEVLATVKFTNPLPVKMEDVTLNIESDELLHGNSINIYALHNGGFKVDHTYSLHDVLQQSLGS